MQETFKVAQADDLVSWMPFFPCFFLGEDSQGLTPILPGLFSTKTPNHTLQKSSMVDLKMDPGGKGDSFLGNHHFQLPC